MDRVDQPSNNLGTTYSTSQFFLNRNTVPDCMLIERKLKIAKIEEGVLKGIGIPAHFSQEESFAQIL